MRRAPLSSTARTPVVHASLDRSSDWRLDPSCEENIRVVFTNRIRQSGKDVGDVGPRSGALEHPPPLGGHQLRRLP